MCVVLLDLDVPPFVRGSDFLHASFLIPHLLVYLVLMFLTMAQRIVDLRRPLATRHRIGHTMVRMVPM